MNQQIPWPPEQVGANVRQVLADIGCMPADIAGHLGLTVDEFHERLRGNVPFTLDELVSIGDHIGLASAAKLYPPSTRNA